MCTANLNSNGQTLIDYWNFNCDSLVAFTPTTQVLAGAGLSYTGASYDSVQQGTTLNAQGLDVTLNSSSAALRLRNPAGPFTLSLPTTGFKNIVLKYAEQRTKQGSKSNIVTYSVNGGTTWINTASASSATYNVDSTDSLTAIPYQLETFDFSSDALVNNNTNFKVQINFANGNTNTSGNNRFDNITVFGTPIGAGVNAVSAESTVYTIYPNPVMNSIEVKAVTTGIKTVIITNAAGQRVYTGTHDGTGFSINTSEFASGTYFISIREDGSSANTMKFIKL